MTANTGEPTSHQRSLWETIWRPALLLCPLAILVRLLVATRREGIDIDGIIYLENARAFLQDWRTINVVHPPLYSLVLAPFLGLWKDPEWGARVISAILGGLWVWPTLRLARETTEERVAWPAGLLVALTPAAVEAGTRILPEALFGLFLMTFLVSLVRTLRTASPAVAGLTGILGALTTLARPEGMGYLLLACGILMFAPLFAGTPWTTVTVLTRSGMLALVWLAVIFPYATLVHDQTGHWHWSGKLGITLLWGETVGEERPNAALERVIAETKAQDVPPGLFAYVAAHPNAMARRVVINLHLMDKYVLPALLHSGGIALVVLGLVHLRFRRAPSPPEWILAAAPLPLAGLLLFLVESRYFVPVLPVLCIVAGIGLARVGRQDASGHPRGRPKSGPLLLAVVLLSFIPWILRPWFRPDPGSIEKAAGTWLKAEVGPGAVFLGRYPRIEYYAAARGIPLGHGPLKTLLAEARTRGVRYLIVDSNRLVVERPALAFLLDGARPESGLDLLKRFEDASGRLLLVYRVNASRRTDGER